MVITTAQDGKVYHDNEREIWCQTFLDMEDEAVVVRDMDGDEYDRYTFDEWDARGPDDMELYNRYSGVSRRVVEDPAGFLEEELYKPRRPDPRGVDVMYASLVTGENVDFFWERRGDHFVKESYSQRVPDPEGV